MARTDIVEGAVTEDGQSAEGPIEQLYLRSAPAATRLAFLITGDAHLAEDISQEAFIRVAGRFGHLRSPSAFDAYLRRAVVNLCTSQFRHRKVERAYLEREASRPPSTYPLPLSVSTTSYGRPFRRFRRGSARRWCSATTKTRPSSRRVRCSASRRPPCARSCSAR